MTGSPGGERALEHVVEIVPAALAGERVDRVVALLTGVTRAEAAELVAAGGVRIRGAVVQQRSRRVAAGDDVVVDVPARAAVVLTSDPSVPVEVVYADADVIVVDKAPGIVVHPGAGTHRGTLVQGLLARFPELAELGASRRPITGARDGDRDRPGDAAPEETPEGHGVAALRPGIVHRLDKGTSGLLVVARSQRALVGLVAQLSARSVERRYDALAWGRFSAATGMIDAPIGRSESDPTKMAVAAAGRDARTRYRVVRGYDRPEAVTSLECRLETGRTHQIRVHLAAIGHPVVGDDRYGGAHGPISCPRPFLHAGGLAFTHPGSGKRLSFTSPLPSDLAAVLETLS